MRITHAASEIGDTHRRVGRKLSPVELADAATTPRAAVAAQAKTSEDTWISLGVAAAAFIAAAAKAEG